MQKLLVIIFSLFIWGNNSAFAQPINTPKPDTSELCPVCGMLVSKYPTWVATLVFKDGHAHHFDGAKDMFKFIHELNKYAKGHTSEDIEKISVKEYYDVKNINAKTAWFVVGSDVLGPMGNEFIPFLNQEDALEFKNDHKGVAILQFTDVTNKWIIDLDYGKINSK